MSVAGKNNDGFVKRVDELGSLLFEDCDNVLIICRRGKGNDSGMIFFKAGDPLVNISMLQIMRDRLTDDIYVGLDNDE